MNKILLIDNFDSFTYNLYHLVQSLYPGKVEVLRINTIPMDTLNIYKAVIISPGPGRPETTPRVMNILKLLKDSIPILGICLGMQCINEYFGGKTVSALQPIHGKVSKLTHTNNGLIFKNIPQNIDIARYHSLIIEPALDVKVIGYSDDGVIMSIYHKTRPIYGLQFHPESFLSQFGDVMIKNFLKEFNLI